MRRLLWVGLWLIFVCQGVLAQDNNLLSVKVIPLPDNRLRVDFHFEQPLTAVPASFATKEPPRLIFDFPHTQLGVPVDKRLEKINFDSILQYRVVSVADRVRVLVDLEDKISYAGHVSGRTYTVTFTGKSSQIFSRSRSIYVTKRPVYTKYKITKLDFTGTDKKGGRIIFNVSDTSVPVDVTQTGDVVTANFLSTSIPIDLMKRYDVADFNTPVKFFSIQQDGVNVHVAIKNNSDYGYFSYQVDKQFIIDVFPLSTEEAKALKLKEQVFTGKRISLNFQDIPVRSVLQLLADFTGLNMVVSDTVSGNITLKLDDVPWDQALNIILTMRSLDKREMGNVMLIAPAAEIAAREKQELTAVQGLDEISPLRAELIQINYAKAEDIANLIKDKTSSLLSKRGSVNVDVRTNSIWIQDTGAKIEEVRSLIKKLDIPVKQVLIEARIVDVTKDITEDLGIKWGVSKPLHLSGTLEGANQLAQGTAPADVTPITDRLNVDLGANPVVGTPASLGIALASLGAGILLDLELSALESEGLGEIIASPRLITANQQDALIEAGEDIPYQEATSSGATAVSFKKAVLSLKVTPQITPDGRILMQLKITQDTPSAQLYNGVPAILTKELDTNVLVDNGQTIVLGGIYKRDKTNTVVRVPFFGTLPVVGILFKQTQETISNEELLIFITPKIITDTLSITAVEGRGTKEVYK